MGPMTTAVLDDTCGNRIQIVHRANWPSLGPAGLDVADVIGGPVDERGDATG